jgi:copper transport protein
VRRLLAAFAFVTLGLALASPRAEAHALLARSDPAAGALLDKAPPVVLLTFTERPDPALSIVHVLDSAGRAVERGRAAAVESDRNSLVAQVPGLGRGAYTVTWRTTSSVDGHSTGGSFAFGVGVAPPAAASASRTPPTPAPSTLSIAGRWLLYLGLAALLGLVAMVRIAGSAFSVPVRGLRLLWAAAAAGVALLAVDLVRTTRVSPARLASTTTGTKLLVEIGAVALVGLVVASRRRGAGTALGVTVAAALLARAWGGHAAAASPALLAIGLQWLHLLALGVWLGGLPWLAAVLRSAPPGERARIAARFSAIATVALAVTVLSGTVRAIDEVGSWRGLFRTSFGVALLVKLAIVALVVALGARNRFRHVADAGDRLRRNVVAEAFLAAGILAVTAVLAGLPPAKSLNAARATVSQVVVRGSDFATTTRVRLVVAPGGVGPNHFDAAVTDYDSGRLVDARRVALRLAPVDRPEIPASTLELAREGTRWTADSPVLAVAGRWRVTVVVETAAGGKEIPLTLETRQPAARITALRTPGLPTIYTITIGARRTETYVDPGKPGLDEVHFTFLDAAGIPTDTGIASITAKATGSAPEEALDYRRLEAGHFVADAKLTSGKWTFTARTTDGLRVSFTETIAG